MPDLFDAVLIPGGGLTAAGEPLPWVRARLHHALTVPCRLWIPLSAGTPHRPPPLDEDGFPILESDASARYLIAKGAPPDRILAERLSLDTIGNAFFSRLLFADPLRLRRLLVVTSDFHMARTRAVFHWIYRLAPSVAQLSFEETPAEGLTAAALSARVAKERAGLAGVASLAERLRSLDQVHEWLFREHAAYQAAPPARRRQANQGWLDSY